MWKDQFLQHLKESTVQESHFEKVIALKHNNLPKRIYKYRSDNEYAWESLRSSTIWLASPDSYNDPYDCTLRFSQRSMISAFERGLIDPLDAYLRSHLINPKLLRGDDFDAFMADRQMQLLSLIEQATGKTCYTGMVKDEGEEMRRIKTLEKHN